MATVPIPHLRHRSLTLFLAVSTVAGAGCGGDSGTAPPAVTVSVSPTTLALEVGETAPLSATISGASGATVSWSSSSTAVARVDDGGTVTGVTAGTATITASVVGQAGVSASAAVTVSDLPLAVRIIGFFKDGQPIDPGALSGRMEARVELEAPVTFVGSIEIVAGSTVLGAKDIAPASGSVGASPGPPLTPPALTIGESTHDVPIAISVFDRETLEASVPNNRDVSAIARLIPGLGGPPVQGPGITIRGNQPPVLLVDEYRFSGGTLTGTNEAIWGNGDLVARVRLQQWGAGSPLADLGRIEVLKGPQGTLFGGGANAGVVTLTIPADQTFANGGFQNEEGEFRWGQDADVTLADGTGLTVMVGNGIDLFPDFSGSFFVDNRGPTVTGGLAFPSQFWLSSDLQARLSLDQGLRWVDDANGSATVVDLGVGGVHASIVGGFSLAYELGEYFDGSSLAETPPALYVKADFTDDFNNLMVYPFLDGGGNHALAGIDRTPPAAPGFRIGSTWTYDGAINPGTPNFGWDAFDLPGAGGVMSGISDQFRVKVSWERADEFGCIVGTLDNSACLPEIIGGGIQNGFAPDLSGVVGPAEFTLDAGAFDKALNPGPFSAIRWLRDTQAPVLTGLPELPAILSGTISVTGPFVEDDLELGGILYFSQFQAVGLEPLTLFSAAVGLGQPFDGTFVQSATPTGTFPWIPSVETVQPGFPSRPTGSIYTAGFVTASVTDNAFNQAFATRPVTTNQPRTTSFFDAGMDHLGFRAGPMTVCGPYSAAANACGGVPTQIDLDLEAFTSGQFEINGGQLWGVVPSTPGQISLAALSEVTPLTVLDQGSYREARATFTLDALMEHLPPGFLDVVILGTDPTGAAVMSNPLRVVVR